MEDASWNTTEASLELGGSTGLVAIQLESVKIL